jgi:ABC-type Na+ transport system ATPase subunit NatA
MSVYNQDEDEGDENCTYDRVQETNKINDLVNMNLSNIEEKIISNALSAKKKIEFNAQVYQCTADEFNNALNSLKNKMSLLGLEV